MIIITIMMMMMMMIIIIIIINYMAIFQNLRKYVLRKKGILNAMVQF